MGNNSSCKSEREFLSQYNAIYQVMYDQKHIKDFLFFLRQKLSDSNHFSKIPCEKMFACFQDDIEVVCLKLSLSDLDQQAAIVYSLGKMRDLKLSYDNQIQILKAKLSLEKSKLNNKYQQLFERFLLKYEELKQMIDNIEKLDIDTIKTCLKSISKTYRIPLGNKSQSSLQQLITQQKNENGDELFQLGETCCSIQFEQESEYFEAF